MDRAGIIAPPRRGGNFRYAGAACVASLPATGKHRLEDCLAYALQQLINGISLGMIYGLIAVGYTMVYGIIGMINFAHGDVFMIGAFLSLIAVLLLSMGGMMEGPAGILLVLLFSIAVTGAYGWAIERIAYRPLRGSFRLAPLISAIGLSIVLQNFVQVSQGARVKPMGTLVPGGVEVMRDEGFVVQFAYTQMMIIGVTLAVLAVFTILVTRTPLGRAMRACEQDRKMASLLGIDTDRTISLTFVIGAALAAVAGTMYLLRYGVIDFYIGFLAGVKAFTAAVLGGIGSLPGAVLGGLLIGLIETFWSAYGSAQYKDVAAFAVLILVLIAMPSGLLGRADVEKV
jgi:branched-chain amino acid transport system permease protein